MAEALLYEELKLRGMERKVLVRSAGTHVGLPGQSADARARKICAREGIDLRKSRARQVVVEDFERHAYIFAMDKKNLAWLQNNSPPQWRERISLVGSWAVGEIIEDIPDPYFGSESGFENVLALLHRCMDGVIAELTPR
ncbi:MAG: low molecular weight phosphotyrosine protein phosphatase [Halioglobus sp.]|nr:low molecular weight phosphotyrosine protein phosphatase [Halioglobus sp.]